MAAGLAPLRSSGSAADEYGCGPTQRALAAERAKRDVVDMQKAQQCRCVNVSHRCKLPDCHKIITASYVERSMYSFYSATVSLLILHAAEYCVFSASTLFVGRLEGRQACKKSHTAILTGSSLGDL